jgi:hypothetical protein
LNTGRHRQNLHPWRKRADNRFFAAAITTKHYGLHSAAMRTQLILVVVFGILAMAAIVETLVLAVPTVAK